MRQGTIGTVPIVPRGEGTRFVGAAIGRSRPIVSIPPWLGIAVARVLGAVVGDVVVTPEEVAGLMQNLLVTESPPAGRTALSTWARENREILGRRYSSALARRRDRRQTYEALRRSPKGVAFVRGQAARTFADRSLHVGSCGLAMMRLAC